jgi:hypothetical protein
MSEFEIFTFVTLALAVCLIEWRIGFFVCLVMGFLQDPIRKIIPEEPVYFTVLIGGFVAATMVGAYSRGVHLNFRPIHIWNPVLKLPLTLFITLVLLSSMVTLASTSSFILAGIGLLAYLTPLPAILLGYFFSRNERDIMRVLKVYLVVSVLMTSGIYLSFMGYDWDVLRSVGEGLIAYSPSGEQLVLFSGFLRSPEIAAWHAGTSICLLVLLSLVVKRQAALTSFSGFLILFFVGGLLLTGRRKFLAEIFLFISLYGILMTRYRKGIGKHAFILMFGLAVALVGYFYLSPDQFRTGFDSYYERGATVQEDGTQRVFLMTVDSFQWVISKNGFLGSGAGTGSQGAQHFGGGSDLVGMAAEGGLAKVLAELGVPGLVLLLWLLISMGRYLWSIIMHVKEENPIRAKIAYGLVTFLIANVLVYAIAHQVFGDLYVLVILGFFLGFILAIPRMQEAPKGNVELRIANRELPIPNSQVPIRNPGHATSNSDFVNRNPGSAIRNL